MFIAVDSMSDSYECVKVATRGASGVVFASRESVLYWNSTVKITTVIPSSKLS